MLVFITRAFAQENDKAYELLKNELKFPLNKEGNSYSKITFATQFWTRYAELNEGSTTSEGIPLSAETDFALRRTRFSMFNNFNDRLILYTQLGFNNLNTSSSKPQLFFHDVWGMFRILPKSLYLGFGLNGWSGISRLSNTSYQRTLTLDNPGINTPYVNHSDLSTRQLGLFIKGTAARLSYRMAITKPFEYNGIPDEPGTNVAYEYPTTKLQYKGYAAFHFLDKEYFSTPYIAMTYMGTKKIFNIGAGFDISPESVAEFGTDENYTIKDRYLWGTDIFLELPMRNNQTISVYSVYYNYNFGKNYLRLSGVMNKWDGGTSYEGAGNNEFKIGTGDIWYSTAGYLFPKDFLKLQGRVQLFYAFSLKDFEAFETNIYNHDFGANYYIAGQKLKLSAQYSLRSILADELDSVTKYRKTIILQVQIAI